MEITDRSKGSIHTRILEDHSLRNILSEGYRKAQIYIARAFDPEKNFPYTVDAFLSGKEADEYRKEAADRFKSDPSVHIISGTISDLENGKMIDKNTGNLLNDIDMNMALFYIRERDFPRKGEPVVRRS